MKRLLLIIILVPLTTLLIGQIPLTYTHNSWRHGDILLKVQVPYVDPSDGGENAVWRLGEVTENSHNYLQAINSNEDTIAIYQEGQILHYLVRNDTLYHKGVQSRRAYKVFSEERPTLHYPFLYGDSISGNFVGKGIYEDTQYNVQGFGYTVADGEGILTDGVDTLRHVMRLHLADDYVQFDDRNNPIHIVEDCHQWYCAGYRYAVMESKRTYYLDRDNTIPIDSVSFLFLPIMQMELAEDKENQAMLDELLLLDATTGSTSSISDNAFISLKANLSSDGTSLTIDYLLKEDSQLGFYASDLMGAVLASAQYSNREAGEWHDCLVLTHRPIGSALMLRIQFGEQQICMKVATEQNQ